MTDASKIIDGGRLAAVDSGSTYEPNPMLTYEWDPTGPNFAPVHRVKQSLSGQGKPTYDLGPHPADPMAASFSQSPTDDGHMYQSPQARKETVPGQELWAYVGNAGCVSDLTHACLCFAEC